MNDVQSVRGDLCVLNHQIGFRDIHNSEMVVVMFFEQPSLLDLLSWQ